MLTELPPDMNGVVETQAAVQVIDMNPDAKKMPEEKAQLFHHLVAKLLYQCRHAQRY